MSELIVRGASVLVDGAWVQRDLAAREGVLVAADEVGPDASEIGADGFLVAPGYIDLQCNGGLGIDLASEPERLWELAAELPRFGVTAWLPTIVSTPDGIVDRALGALAAGPPDGWRGAVPVGLHLEGPFLSPAKRGAHPEALLRPPSLAAVEGWSREAGVAVVTIAPDLPGATEVITELVGRGVVVSLGHTPATAAQATGAVDAGARWVTHLFNAMAPLHHREPGLPGVALADERLHVGLIPDGVHVHPQVVATAQRALGARLTIVTDAVGALGMPPGRQPLGRGEVIVGEDGVRLADGTLAGSNLAMDQGVRNLVTFTGCATETALSAAAAAPAAVLEDAGRGQLTPGARADLVVLTEDLHLVSTIVGGEVVHDAAVEQVGAGPVPNQEWMPTSDTPWSGDAASLVDAFRAGERSPVEELDATLAAVEASDLNAFAHVDPERAREAATRADVSLPFGGVPTAIKELDPVEGWPWTEASLVYRDRIGTFTSHQTQRLFERGGVVPVGKTTASEFGGLNVSTTKINGVTHNPWRHGKTVGGSSGGSAAAVSGGLVSLATGGDGGGSIRIPAGYTGLLGMKGTFGRIPRGPHAFMRPNTVVLGNLARSVRDAARYYDVCAGVHPYDPSSLPSHGRWEAELGTNDLTGLRVAVVPNLGGVDLEPGVEDRIRAEAKALIADHRMVEVDLRIEPPNLAAQWMMGNLATLLADLGPAWPGCSGDLTDEVAVGLHLAEAMYNLRTAAVAEELRIQANEVMADAFDQVDLVIAATNPGPAFNAEWVTSSPQAPIIDRLFSNGPARYVVRALLGAVRVVSGAVPKLPSAVLGQASTRFPDLVNMGALTIISNIYGNPAVSIPAGTVDGLPVGMQVLAAHHRDGLLFDVALAVERERPWPLVAPAG